MLIPPPGSPLKKLFTSRTLMGSRPFFKAAPLTGLPTNTWRTHLFHPHTFVFSASLSKSLRNIHPSSLRSTGLCSISHANIPRPVSQVSLESPEEDFLDLIPLRVLRKKMSQLGIDSKACRPGQYNHLICPMCKGGDSGEATLSLFIAQDGNSALWTCFRGKCGWKGNTRAFADGKSTYGKMNQIPQVKKTREIAEDSLELEPLCNELLAYFAERMISTETLRRNSVMQRKYDGQVHNHTELRK
ncbi:twinkle homolog protein, chloroplastic/mitochondrial-like [Diospyros lotus]|uniref:twinkle homolog protein, chloroplastic/mitochondrial-like n=1 Tax=Diospyros lotus TaxID=55363 RepID=UPI00224CA6DF|nr:twinkle homolog protein, chloroplastic/mitochondrial-like [Diospyros lotus]